MSPDCKIVTYNVHGCVGLDFRRHPGRVQRVLASLDAQVIALQEVWIADASVRDARGELLDAFRHRYHVTLGPTLSREQRQYGNVLLTQTPPDEVERVSLSYGSREPRRLIDARVGVAGLGRVRVMATHLGLSSAERRTQTRIIAGRLRATAGPTLLLGDFNEIRAGSATFAPLRAAGLSATTAATFPSPWPVLALERIWTSAGIHVDEARAYRSFDCALASDHLPLQASLRVAAGRGEGVD